MDFGMIFVPVVPKPDSSRISLKVPMFSASSTNILTASFEILESLLFRAAARGNIQLQCVSDIAASFFEDAERSRLARRRPWLDWTPFASGPTPTVSLSLRDVDRLPPSIFGIR